MPVRTNRLHGASESYEPLRLSQERSSMEDHESTVYNLTIDYRFELIRRAGSTVNLRIDYTNLVPYWVNMTGEESEAGSKSKRALRHEKRWWGSYSEWLKKLNTVRTWGYYAQRTIVPLNVDTIYTYFKLHPEVQAVLEIDGSAEMVYRSPRIRIIHTLSYPGLAIKGIAAVGPTLDLYRQMEAGASTAGKLSAD
ncbi:hypothetical protein BBP40_010255 [Aspergillus hancockii]|nr:hypothetical protein BBP40_010255 [Aspergillus hancockii]